MLDVNWLSQEARTIHQIFFQMFYALVTVLLLLGVVCEYFKLPLGGMPAFSELVGRTLIAAILLYSYSEVTNALSDFTDALSQKIGDFNQFHLVLSRMGDKLKELSWSWISIKDSLVLAFSFITFFLLYISVYLANAGVVYVWIILYVFSPLLIALFVLPATSFATKALYRSLIEVCAWKVTWAVLGALLWSSSLGQMNSEGSSLNFLTVIAYNLILAISLILTPFVVNALASSGLSQASASWLGLAAGAAAFSPGVLAKSTATKGIATGRAVAGSAFSPIKKQLFEKTASLINKSSQNKPLQSIRMVLAAKPKSNSSNQHKHVPPGSKPSGGMTNRHEREKPKFHEAHGSGKRSGKPSEPKGTKK